MAERNDQKHPKYAEDRALASELMAAKEPSDRQMADLARLLIRYRGFPGARDIQADLQATLQRWQLTEEELFELTREIHARGKIYPNLNDGRDDWA